MADFRSESFSVHFNKCKLKYHDLDEIFTDQKYFKNTGDKVNVFIDLETVYKHILLVQELEKQVVVTRDLDRLLESNILNLIAHYKKFFTDNNMDVKVYLYQTDFNSSNFKQTDYNSDYRAYYQLKFTNPKYIAFTDCLNDGVLKHSQIYCNYIPDVHFIIANNIDGFLVPMIIANMDKTRKNVIISGEFAETQYSFLPNFLTIYVNKVFTSNIVLKNPNEYLSFISKKSGDELQPYLDTFNTYHKYCFLLSILGDKQRNISGIPKLGPATFLKLILLGKERQEIHDDVTNPIVLGDIFHNEEIKMMFTSNFYCSCFEKMYEELTEAQKKSIINQCVDRFDFNSLDTLNKTRFVNHPILLSALF